MRTLLALMALAMLAGCSTDWEGVVYKDSTEKSRYERLGPFATLEDCRREARALLSTYQDPSFGDYECGKNCFSNDQGMFMCREKAK